MSTRSSKRLIGNNPLMNPRVSLSRSQSAFVAQEGCHDILLHARKFDETAALALQMVERCSKSLELGSASCLGIMIQILSMDRALRSLSILWYLRISDGRHSTRIRTRSRHWK